MSVVSNSVHQMANHPRQMKPKVLALACKGVIKSCVETVTPERAFHDLERASERKANFRPISPSRVKWLARAITMGKWELNGESLKYDPEGVCTDGQHRLSAVVLANRAIESLIVYGVTSVDEVDRGKPRFTSDLLRNHGEQHPTVLAAAVKLQFNWERGVPSATGPGAVPNAEDVAEVLAMNPGLRDAAAKFATTKRLILPPGMQAFLYWNFQQKDFALANSFFEKLNTRAGLEEGDPVLALINRLMWFENRTGSLTNLDRMKYAIKAWNLARAKSVVSRISLRVNEEWPEII